MHLGSAKAKGKRRVGIPRIAALRQDVAQFQNERRGAGLLSTPSLAADIQGAKLGAEEHVLPASTVFADLERKIATAFAFLNVGESGLPAAQPRCALPCKPAYDAESIRIALKQHRVHGAARYHHPQNVVICPAFCHSQYCLVSVP